MNFSDLTNSTAEVTVSLVSHGHGRMLTDLLGDLAGMPQVAHIILTLNTSELLPKIPAALRQNLTLVRNPIPKGFASNHNAAFTCCKTTFFCVLNPDIRLKTNPFPVLQAALGTLISAVAAPIVINPAGRVEDSVRSFPSVSSLVRKALRIDDGRFCDRSRLDTFPADWVGGMFMLFKASHFRAVNGFDEGFFLYYEDVDICARLLKDGGEVLVCRGAEVTHDARRTSRREIRYALWHMRSMIRYFYKHWLRLPK